MADRGFSASMLTEIAKSVVSWAYLVECEFDSGSLFLTDAARDITWNGDTYERTNGLLGFAGLQETGALLVNQVTLSLSGVDTTIALAKVLADDFLDRPVRIYACALDSAGAVIADPEKIFEGRMDQPTVLEDPDGGTCTVTVRGTPAWADFGRKPGRHTNDEEQQFYFSGDLGFEFVTEIPKNIVWGRN
ncbi:MAG: DUF2163 domain-containing protein [Anaerolineae bacterium]|nr:DUF2163 domain-containing protein [Anaerolineae bacterium]